MASVLKSLTLARSGVADLAALRLCTALRSVQFNNATIAEVDSTCCVRSARKPHRLQHGGTASGFKLLNARGSI